VDRCPPELTLINQVKAEKNQPIGRRGLGLTLTLIEQHSDKVMLLCDLRDR
jgi:hypothetical protein